MTSSPNGILHTAKFWLGILQWFGPVVLALAAGYGAVTATRATMEQRVHTLERDVIDLRKGVEYNRDRLVTREELKAYLDGQTRALDQIQADLRALRRDR